MRQCTFADVAKHARAMARDRLIVRESTAERWFAHPAGFAGIEETPKVLTLKILWVYPELRGCGEGSGIMAEIVALAGARDMRLVADEHLFGFYRRFGFVATRKLKTTGRAWVMVRRPL